MKKIVSNEKLYNYDDSGQEILSYDFFEERTFSEDENVEACIDENDILWINVNDINNPEIYEVLSEDTEMFHFFTLNGNKPNFATGMVENWSQYAKPKEEPKPEKSVEQNTQMPKQEFSFNPQPEPQKYAESKPEPKSNQLFANDELDVTKILENENSQFDDPKPQESNNSWGNGGFIDESMKNDILRFINTSITGEDITEPENEEPDENEDAKIFVFGSSKGGTGKTFTSIISTYRYAKTHPKHKIAMIDFDIIDGQVGISIHKILPTVRKFYESYNTGNYGIEDLKKCSVKGPITFPQNVDFYLAPSQGEKINNDGFWLKMIQLLVDEYDVLVFDTGIDYMNIIPISYSYKIADKIILVTTTSIKSITSVSKQMEILKGKISNYRYSIEDELEPRINVVITQMSGDADINAIAKDNIGKSANIVATFGNISDSVMRCEYLQKWDIFDNNAEINRNLDNIMKL